MLKRIRVQSVMLKGRKRKVQCHEAREMSKESEHVSWLLLN